VRLTSTTGSEFALKIEGYQFSARGIDRYDDNWLQISIEVKSPQGEWNARGPYLLQWEADRLATWLEGMSKVAPIPGNLAFTEDLSFNEPNLRFELRERTGESSTLRLHFEIEFRPPWADKDGESYLDLSLSSDDLLNAARTMRAELREFPARTAERKLKG